MSEKWTLNAIAANLRWASLSRTQRAEIAWQAAHQQEVIQVLTVLPGRHTYQQVDAAIHAANVSPRDIYLSLAANQPTDTLARFYEALDRLEQESTNERASSHR